MSDEPYFENSFYPFSVIYEPISDNTWRGYRDNWTDGAFHHVEYREGKWINITGSVYDDERRETKGVPEDRMAFPTEPFTAKYYTQNGKLYCPNGHLASYNYPYPGCQDRKCPFLRYRQHHYSRGPRGEKKNVVVMSVTVDGVPFRHTK